MRRMADTLNGRYRRRLRRIKIMLLSLTNTSRNSRQSINIIPDQAERMAVIKTVLMHTACAANSGKPGLGPYRNF